VTDDQPVVPLPDDVTIPLDELSELFGAVEDALEAIAATDGHEAPSYRRLDDALGLVSRRVLRQLGFFDSDDG
jgi:hypothetical protein